jgi:hypothetical protein
MEKTNENYSDTEVLEYFYKNIGVQATRKRWYLDNRNYIIDILYRKFAYTEQKIADIIKIERSTVSYSKWASQKLLSAEDISFLEHTENVRETFPYSNSNIITRPVDPRKTVIANHDLLIRNISNEDYIRLHRLAKVQGISVGKYAKKLILSHLDLLEHKKF